MATLSTKAIGWNFVAAGAGAMAALSFAQSHAIDLYAIFDQLKKTYGDISTLILMLTPIASAAGAGYRTWKMKQVSKDSVAIIPDEPHPALSVKGATVANVSGTVAGALLVTLIVFASGGAEAQPLNPLQRAPAIIQSLRDTVIADLTAARDDAHSFSDPSEACWQVLLTHAQTMPPKLMGVAHTAQRLRDFRRGLPDVLDKCAVVKDGAKQALLQIFGTAIGGVSALAAFGF